MRGFTIRTTASASNTSFLRVNFSRTLLPKASGLPVHTKHPPIDKSDVIPLAAVPASRSKHSASAAKGCRIAYRLSRTDSGGDPALFVGSFIKITFFAVTEDIRAPISLFDQRFKLCSHIYSAGESPSQVEADQRICEKDNGLSMWPAGFPGISVYGISVYDNRRRSPAKRRDPAC